MTHLWHYFLSGRTVWTVSTGSPPCVLTLNFKVPVTINKDPSGSQSSIVCVFCGGSQLHPSSLVTSSDQQSDITHTDWLAGVVEVWLSDRMPPGRLPAGKVCQAGPTGRTDPEHNGEITSPVQSSNSSVSQKGLWSLWTSSPETADTVKWMKMIQGMGELCFSCVMFPHWTQSLHRLQEPWVDSTECWELDELGTGCINWC